jgi:molybdopterin-guanine dinucleotide biosynthesis protein A
MNTKGHITGFILAGGASRRMGTDKALMDYGGRLLLLHMASIISPSVRRVVVISNHTQHRGHGLDVIPDIVPGLGPVGGIFSGLSFSDTPLNVFISCDMPLMSGEVIGCLISACRSELVTCGSVSQRIHPLPGIYHRDAVSAFACAIADRQLRLTSVIAGLGRICTVTFPENQATVFGNFNTPDQFQQLNHAHNGTLLRNVG